MVPVATSTNARRSFGPSVAASGAGDVEIKDARPMRAILSSPAAGTSSAAIVLPSGAQKNPTTVLSRRVRTAPDVASSRRSGPTGTTASRPDPAGATNASSSEPRPNAMAATPKTSTECDVARSRDSTTIRPGVASPGATNARKRPSSEAAGTRNAPASTAAGSVATPSGRTSPKKPAGPSPPLWTSSRLGSAHAQYIGEPSRMTADGVLPSTGTTRSARPFGSVVRNVSDPPSGDQYA